MRLKRTILFGLIALFAFTCIYNPAEAETIKWRLQSNEPGGSILYDPIHKSIGPLVKQMSGGRLEITTYPGGALVKSAAALDAVSNNVLEMAIIPGAYSAGKLPIANIEYGIPFTFETMLQMDYFFWDYGFINLIREAYAEQGVYYVAPICGVGNNLMSKVPVYNLEELSKLKVRTPGLMAETLQEAGVSVVFVPGEEIYTSMATGIIDACTWGGAVGQTQLKTYETAKYFIKKPMIGSVIVEAVVVNMKQWNKLPDDLKAIVETAVREISARRMRTYQVMEVTLLKEMVDKHGVEVIEWKDEDIKPLKIAAMKVLDKAAEKDSKFAKPAAKMLKDFCVELGIFSESEIQ